MIVTAALGFPVTSPPQREFALRLQGSVITDTGSGGELSERYPDEEVHSFPDCVLLPGLVNAHCHLEYSSFGPQARPMPFAAWIRRLVRRSALRSRLQGGAFWHDSALRGAERLLRAGITCVGDVVTFGAALEAAAQRGLRLRAYLEAVAIDDGGIAPALERLSVLLDAAESGGNMVRMGLSPHSVYTLAPGAIGAVAALARDRGLPLAMHAAETPSEKELLRGEGAFAGSIERWSLPFGPAFRTRLAEYLDDLGVLGPQTLLVHAVHFTGAERALLRRRGVGFVTCPRSNRLLRGGRAPLGEWHAEGLPFAYGTDSLASTPGFDLFEEAREGRKHFPEEAVPIVRRLTLGGAEAMGFADCTGSLEAGKEGDMVLLRLDDAAHATEEEVISGGSARAVEATMVAGKFLYRKSTAGFT